jgi:hypothetical protein
VTAEVGGVQNFAHCWLGEWWRRLGGIRSFDVVDGLMGYGMSGFGQECRDLVG